jgi:hypothetical protein
MRYGLLRRYAARNDRGRYEARAVTIQIDPGSRTD